MKFKKKLAIRLICPRSPWMDAHGRSTTCLADRCMHWEWTGNRKKDDEEHLERTGYCGLNVSDAFKEAK